MHSLSIMLSEELGEQVTSQNIFMPNKAVDYLNTNPDGINFTVKLYDSSGLKLSYTIIPTWLY